MTDPRERRSVASRAMRPVARFVSAFVEPATYWLGLLNKDGQPDLGSILHLAGGVVMLSMVFRMGMKMDLGDISVGFVSIVVVVLAYCSGPYVFLAVTKLRLSAAKEGIDSPSAGPSIPTAAPTPTPGPGSGA